LSTDYRLQLPYLVRVICLDAVPQTVGTPVATVAARVDRIQDAVAP
jgi:hypothetical protein